MIATDVTVRAEKVLAVIVRETMLAEKNDRRCQLTVAADEHFGVFADNDDNGNVEIRLPHEEYAPDWETLVDKLYAEFYVVKGLDTGY